MYEMTQRSESELLKENSPQRSDSPRKGSPKYSSKRSPNQQSITKDIFQLGILPYIAPSNIKGKDFERSQTSWKRLLESEFNKGEEIKGYDNLEWKFIYDLISQGGWIELFQIDILDIAYAELAFEQIEKEKELNDEDIFAALDMSIIEGNDKIFEYVFENYKMEDRRYEYYNFALSVAIFNKRWKMAELVLTNDKVNTNYYKVVEAINKVDWLDPCIMEKLLNHVNSDGLKVDRYSIHSGDKWNALIKELYHIDIDLGENKGNMHSIAIYNIIVNTNIRLNEYKSDPSNQYKDVHNVLANMLHDAAELKLIYSFKYLIEHGAPITSYKGTSLATAVRRWGLDALKLVSQRRLTNYMRDKIRANFFYNSYS